MIAGLQAAELPADAVEVGRVADAWGIKGWFKVLTYSADHAALFASKKWYVLPAEKGPKAFEGTGLLAVVQAKEHSDSVVAQAEGVADRNAAEALRGSRLFVSRTDFPAASKDEYYWVDLIGLDVINRDDLALGTVRELLSTGPQTVLVLEYTEEGKTRERMIPFVSAYVDEVDLPSRRIRVDWQADY